MTISANMTIDVMPLNITVSHILYPHVHLQDELKHSERGMVSMASRGANTNGSQFFIIYDKQPHLNNINTVFAKVIHGFDILDMMESAPVSAKDRPISDICIEGVTIHANPIAAKEY